MDKYFHLSKEQQLDQIHWFIQAAKQSEFYTVTNIPDENYAKELWKICLGVGNAHIAAKQQPNGFIYKTV
ncbi:unnamed protein product [Fructobacillus fructosus]|uniref:hypothetical protein n=1 Tax=Fructobacillus fructosus TaxID=1631 RepID=UPI002DA26BFF|nr:unnamed protein product [Fructobacillus fructosus]